MSNNLIGDALSRAVAEATGQTVRDFGGHPIDEQQYADDPTLLGEMLEWLQGSAMSCSLEYLSDDDTRTVWRADWAGKTSGSVTRFGSTANEAAARCVVEVGRLLRERGK